MKIRASHIIAVLLAAAAVGWMASGMTAAEQTPADTSEVSDSTSSPEAKSAVEQSAIIVPVRVRESFAQAREIRVQVFGQTEANRSVDVRAETDGLVKSLDLVKGDLVEDGALILSLELGDRSARRDRAKAEVEFRTVSYQAAKKLEAKQFQSKIKLAEEASALAQAKAALREIDVEIADTRIRVPFAGVVNDLPVEVGDYVQEGDVIATVVELDPVVIAAEVTENWVAGVQVGEPALIELATGVVLHGQIRFVSRVASAETRTFRVEIESENTGNRFGEGVTSEVTIPVGETRAHKITPALLTLDDDGRLGLKAVDADNRVEFHTIKIVEDSTEGMWVSGPPDRLTIITVGQEFVAVGGIVEPIDESTIIGDVKG